MHTRSFSWLAVPVAGLCLVLPAASQTSTNSSQPAAASMAPPAMQVPPDRKAWRATTSIADTDEHLKALQAFLHDFPDSKLDPFARKMILKLLLAQEPQNKREIHQAAKAIIDTAEPNARADEENSVAFDLAEAAPNGADLKSAESWSKDAVDKTTIAAVVAQTKESLAKFKGPMPSADALQKIAGSTRAAYLQTLADVYFHEGKLDKASMVLDEAQHLEPLEGDIFLTRGQIAHARHNDTEAIQDLELAELYGGINASGNALLVELYAAQHPNDPSGLDAELDKRYRSLEQPFTPSPHTAAASGRTVFVELYTGSGCEPCVAADLGMDGILESYPRTEVVALSFDQHIPQPDPLANADTAARGEYIHLGGTPHVLVDGQSAPVLGGDRSRAKGAFEALSKAIDTDLSTPSGVTLELTASLTPVNTIAASAQVHVTDPAALGKALTAKHEEPSALAAADKSADKKEEAAKPAPVPEPPNLVLNFALVQKDVRYSGENGIRFHSMVVRALAKPSTDAFPIASTGGSNASFTFDPAAVSDTLSKYLAEYQKHNASFGPVHFLMTDTTLPPADLAVAAWVEDTKSHRVVAAAFVPLQQHTTQTATR
ncbi:MAG TPA: hypothetical protein VGU25_01770 [Acidobacteriaceae bacterium]|nr:hypothetical protein [Acidobacteriaceae bacterium]